MLEVGSIGSRKNNEVDFLVVENLIQGCDDFHAREEIPGIRLLRGSFPLEDRVESVELGEGEDEGDVEDAEKEEEEEGREGVEW